MNPPLPVDVANDSEPAANHSTAAMANHFAAPSASASASGAGAGAATAEDAGTTTSTNPTSTGTRTGTGSGSGSQTSKQSSASNSVTPSPMASRDPSPTRQLRRATSPGRLAANSKPRLSTLQDLSPARLSRIPVLGPNNSSLRSLSATSSPILPSATQDSQQYQAPTPQKPILSPDLKDPRWPVSPRLRSPPPQQFRIPPLTPRQVSPEAPLINLQQQQQHSPSSSSSHPSTVLAAADYQQTSESEAEDMQMPSGLRTPARGPLETVQEVSQPNSPAQLNNASLLEQVKEKLTYSDPYSDLGPNDGSRTLRARPNWPVSEGAGDSSGIRLEMQRTSSVPPPPLPPPMARQSSSMSTKHVKPRPEGSTQHMTVETETVTSFRVPLTAGSKTDGTNTTLRTKPSTETIKPKREKRRSTRKQPSVSNGNASSKADIFEAKIASAVDEANTSDSEETFVYDSNPPDIGDRVTRRFHSRTPSVASMASQADRQNLRSIYGIMEGVGHAPVPKKSMKFGNTFTGVNGNDSLIPGDEDGRGTGRSTGGSARGTVRQHHHIGRWGRQPGNGHASLFDNESPFPNARSKLAGHQSRTSSNPPSPRPHHSARNNYLNPKRSVMHISSSCDMDDTTGADDERTPLMERSTRNARFRRPHNLRQAESQQTYTRRSSYLNRFAACLVLTMMFLLVVTGAIGFMFATSQPMTGIEIVSIKNVVTSEQVLIFDVTVKAHNPNIVVVTIDNANLEIFAKSEFAGADSTASWKAVGPGDGTVLRPRDDPVNDPPAGDGDDSRPNVLLGRITEFDSPLTFEGSLFHQGTSSSTGQMQLAYPGNTTTGGSERWEKIYQNEFDLIVKGVVKYSLPLSTHIRSATVAGRTTVKPNSANDPSLKPPNDTALYIGE